jgi:hypothetical protein
MPCKHRRTPVLPPAGKVTLVLDFGRFLIESDPGTAAALPSQEAALYECIRLNGTNVAAYVVDGDFSWQRQQASQPVAESACEALPKAERAPSLPAGGLSGLVPRLRLGPLDRARAAPPPTPITPQELVMVPILEPCRVDVALQAARFPDPNFPTLRLQPSLPQLHFYLSPGRLGRLLRVINAALPGVCVCGCGVGVGGGGGSEQQHGNCPAQRAQQGPAGHSGPTRAAHAPTQRLVPTKVRAWQALPAARCGGSTLTTRDRCLC